MKLKVGRPTHNPRKIQAKIRLSEDEEEMVKVCAEALRKTKADVIRSGIEIMYKLIPISKSMR